MAAVGLGWEEAEKYLVPGVVVACDNSPNSVTLYGDAKELKVVVDKIKALQPNVLLTILKVEKAYHSHHMVEIGEEYHQAMIRAHVTARMPSKPFFSSVTGSLLPSSKINGNPLVRDHSLQSVSFYFVAFESRCQRKSTILLLKTPEILSSSYPSQNPAMLKHPNQ